MESQQTENKDQINLNYSLSTQNIKFPLFLDEELNSYYQKEGMTKEILIDNLTNIINNLKPIIDVLKEITLKDTNTFNSLCLKYNINSYDFISNIKLIQEMASVILSKVQGNDEQIKLSTLEDFFPKENDENKKEVLDLIKTQYNTIDKDFQIIKTKISSLIEKIKIIYETKEECGIPLMCYLLKFYLKFIDKVKAQLDSFTSIENFKNADIKIFRKNMIIYFDLVLILQNFQQGFLLLYNGYLNDKNDIFNFEENSKEWENLKKVFFRVNYKDLNKIKEEYKKQNDETTNSTYYMKKFDSNSNIFTNITKVAGTAIKYKLNSDENLKIYEMKESKLLYNKVLLEEIFKVFKIKIFKNQMKKGFPPIKQREKIYMKREHPEINLEYIKSLLIKIYDEGTILKNFENTNQPEREPLDENIMKGLPLWAEKLKKEEKKYYVSTRLFSSQEIKINKKMPEEKKSFNLFGFLSKSKNNPDTNKVEFKPKELLIHIHGGGFLDCSTFICENYLRETSNETGIPIIGINYGCAPKHPYPEGLNDCFQAYMWIMEHCEQELGFKPEKIFLSGDSAGGSFILGLTLLIIAMNEFDGKKIKIPDLILALYPCCTLNSSGISLSGCVTLDNLILSLKDTTYMRIAYRGYYKNELDPFLNQMKANEKLLNHFPASRFFLATNDGLRDEAVRFINKLSQINGIDVKAYDFTYYEHGFMGNKSKILREAPHNIFFQEIKEFIKK